MQACERGKLLIVVRLLAVQKVNYSILLLRKSKLLVIKYPPFAQN